MATKTATRRPRTKVDPNESPEVKFTRLANKRGKKLVDMMKLLKNLSTSYTYKTNSELAKKWLDSFEESFKGLKESWENAINVEKEPAKTEN